MSTRKYFGTDGVRGKVGQFPITPDFMLKLGWAAGRVLAQQGTKQVIIGKDTRISGYMLESALEAGLAAAGLKAYIYWPNANTCCCLPYTNLSCGSWDRNLGIA